MLLTVKPLQPAPGSAVDFGVEIDGVDLEHLTVLFKNQQNLSPKAQYELTKRFDPAADQYGHDKTTNKTLAAHLKAIPHQPQVQVKGNGFVESYEGLENVQLRHPHHRNFHRDPIPGDQDGEFTRFYRWHIDAALYDGKYPPKVTTLMAIKVPKGRRQTILYDDGSGEMLENAPLATTAFVSGQKMFAMLSPEDQEFVKTSKIEYAPHPYAWIKPARSHPTGLGLYTENLEQPPSNLPPIDPFKIQTLPMTWRNPVTGNLSLQIHPSPIRKIHLSTGAVIDDLARVRDIVYRLQRPAISPQFVYAHDWAEGDMVLFNNHGVLHSMVGTLGPEEVRVFRQCNLAASEAPRA